MATGGLTIEVVIAGGVAGGFAAGFTGSLLNSGSLGDAFKAGIVGAAPGGIFAGVAHGIGSLAQSHAGFRGFWQAVAHGGSQGALTEATGGEFRHGFYGGFFTSAAGPAIMGSVSGATAQTAAAAIVGGTASALGGGKFANRAISGAFTFMFNDRAHKERARIKHLKATITPVGQHPRDLAKMKASSENLFQFMGEAVDQLVGLPMGPVEMLEMSGIVGPGDMLLDVDEFAMSIAAKAHGTSLWVEVAIQKRGWLGWGATETYFRPVANHTAMADGWNPWVFASQTGFSQNRYAIARFDEEALDVLNVMHQTYDVD